MILQNNLGVSLENKHTFAIPLSHFTPKYLPEKKGWKRRHAIFHLYKTLANADYSLVAESRSLVA